MKRILQAALAIAAFAQSPLANALWMQGQVTELRVIATGVGEDKIVVFTTATIGCTYNAFHLLSSDSFFKETYALLLAAKASGQTIKFDHVYCHSNGYSRANQFSVIN